ncbi:hypothetical protein MMC13_001177 [Lambiella insularis]|nr:hypothetical protein [Lambiella insularis]
MSADEVDEELPAFLPNSFGPDTGVNVSSPETSVLRDAEYIYNNSIDVAIDSQGTRSVAETIWTAMRKKDYSRKSWSAHELHPKAKDEVTVNFIFTMDLLNFSFWPASPSETGYMVDYQGKHWTGYWSLVAALQRALGEGIPITDSHFWQDESKATDKKLEYVFRSSSSAPIPLLPERIACLREVGRVMYNRYNCNFINCLKEANGSAAALVGLIADAFPCFRDEVRFERRLVRFYKRAQILVADLWACFDGKDFGYFKDIDDITMFADYRIPQMLQFLGCLQYSPSLRHHIRQLKQITHGHSWEIQLRGCSIWCVELIRREILRRNPDAYVNAILIDFFLYDMVKEQEAQAVELEPHHRTRSIWY